ncbi:unnamed protein product [Pleuronectes platessa]|uniref:Uncharacterized protein n=1 Tax=Pleuronectes platessa TaxID=8262 RepID=A0A9N7U0J2_PLEPL|nr:unnamed protein product [Pleuronectes platessa]
MLTQARTDRRTINITFNPSCLHTTIMIVSEKERKLPRWELLPERKDCFLHILAIPIPSSTSSSCSSSSSPHNLFILLTTPVFLLRGFRAGTSYRGFPGLQARLRRSYCHPHSLLSAP